MMNKHTFHEYLKKELNVPRFKKGFEEEKWKLSLGYRIFLTREREGITQGELARRIGTKQSNISRLEQGNYNFSIEMLERIARAFNYQLKIELISPRIKKAA